MCQGYRTCKRENLIIAFSGNLFCLSVDAATEEEHENVKWKPLPDRRTAPNFGEESSEGEVILLSSDDEKGVTLPEENIKFGKHLTHNYYSMIVVIKRVT